MVLVADASVGFVEAKSTTVADSTFTDAFVEEDAAEDRVVIAGLAADDEGSVDDNDSFVEEESATVSLVVVSILGVVVAEILVDVGDIKVTGWRK